MVAEEHSAFEGAAERAQLAYVGAEGAQLAYVGAEEQLVVEAGAA